MAPALPLLGGCQCGALRYRVSASPLTVYNCHCTNCQRITTSAFAISVIVPEDAFCFTGGAPKLHEWTADSGARIVGRFCGACGVRIAHGQAPSAGYYSVRAGTFDDQSWIKPVADIWTRSARPWIRFTGERIEIEGHPPDYGRLIDAFAAQQQSER